MQLGWFACVCCSTGAHPWIGPWVVFGILVVHVCARAKGTRATEVTFLAASAVLGFLVDTALLRAGVIVLGGPGVSRPWLIALWPNLAMATATGGSLGWLARSPWLAALVGGVAGALAYYAGSRLGALGLGAPPSQSLTILGVAWSSVLPTLFALRARLPGLLALRHARVTAAGRDL
jgi:hypothetical protein